MTRTARKSAHVARPVLPPAERGQHDGIVVEETMQAGVYRARVTTQTPLDRYLTRDQITKRQYDAGQRLYADWYRAGSSPHLIGTYGPPTGGEPALTDAQAYARRRVNEAMRRVGIRLSPILVSVVLLGEAARETGAQMGEPKAGIVVLKLALDSLADHYGMGY